MLLKFVPMPARNLSAAARPDSCGWLAVLADLAIWGIEIATSLGFLSRDILRGVGGGEIEA